MKMFILPFFLSIFLIFFLINNKYTEIKFLEENEIKNKKIETLETTVSELSMELTKCRLGGNWPHEIIKTPKITNIIVEKDKK